MNYLYIFGISFLLVGIFLKFIDDTEKETRATMVTKLIKKYESHNINQDTFKLFSGESLNIECDCCKEEFTIKSCSDYVYLKGKIYCHSCIRDKKLKKIGI